MRCLQWVFVVVLSTTGRALAADWPQWLGPNRDGTSSEKIAPWKGDLTLAWKKAIGEGNSSPVVANGLVYMHVKVKDKDIEKLQAFDAKSGDLKWENEYEKAKFKPFFGEGPRSTPCVDSERVYSYGNTGVLCCWTAAEGKLVWKVDVLKELDEANLVFGISCSPIVVGDFVLVMAGKVKQGAKPDAKEVGQKGSGIVAFNKKDGKLVWKAGNDPGSYASPILVGNGDKRQIVTLTGAHVLAVSPKGDVVWKHPFVDSLSESSTTPVKVNDLVIASSVKAGAVALKTENSGVKQEWKNPDLTCYFSTPISVGKDHLYMVTGVATLTGATITLRCVETATGKEVWNKPKMGKFHAALLKLGDGNLLFHTDGGELMLLAPDVKQYKELARTKVCGDTWAHPALANGLLYVRDGKELLCYKVPSGE
jgi:outer membrane protein assembly factor BamB